MILITLRILSFVITVLLGIMWAVTREFVPWGVSCIISAIVFLALCGEFIGVFLLDFID